MEYNGNLIFAHNPIVNLRNDDWCIVAGNRFRNTIDNEKNWIFRPNVGLIYTFFNGKRTVNDVAEIVSYFRNIKEQDNPQKAARRMVWKLLEEVDVLNSRSKNGKNIDFENRILLHAEELADLDIDAPLHDTNEFIANESEYSHFSKIGKLKQPLLIQFIMTEKCATDCSYCYMDRSYNVDKNLMPWSRIKEMIEEINSFKIATIDLLGGDIFLYEHFWNVMDLLAEYRFPAIHLSTKTYISPEIAKRIKEHPAIASIQFSLDSTVPEIADYLTNTKGFYQRIKESVKNCKNAGVQQIDIKSVITPYNILTIPRLYRDLDAWDVSTITVATYGRSGKRHHPSLFNWEKDYIWLEKQLEKLKVELPHRIDQIGYQNGSPDEEPVPKEEVLKKWELRTEVCTAGKTQLAIYGDGRVTFCEQTRIDEAHVLGSIKDNSIEDVWNSDFFNKRTLYTDKEMFKGTECYNCDEYIRCRPGGIGCVRDAQTHFGTSWGPIPGCPMAPDSRFV